jgi:glycosyltransferase involved in cell wall biosynthesis
MPPNKRTVALETVILETAKHHNIKLLTLAGRGDLHLFLESKGIVCETMEVNESNPILRIIKHTIKLVQYCRKNQIDTLWSHLHPCNLYAVLAQFFIPSKTIIFRHHFHAQIKKTGFVGLNKSELWTEKIICALTDNIVVPSSEVYNGMVQYENVNPKKIQIIPYIYNFEYYNKPDIKVVEEIRSKYHSKLLILVAMRMIPLKRHFLVLPIFKKLLEEKMDIQVLILDGGELESEIKSYIENNKLSDHVHVLGYKTNIVDYIKAVDLIVHPSYTEASSSLIKEAGLYKKVVIVSKGVGDFDEYIINEVNGFSVNENNEEIELETYIRKIYNEEYNTKIIREELCKTVIEKFSGSEKTLQLYFNTIEK